METTIFQQIGEYFSSELGIIVICGFVALLCFFLTKWINRKKDSASHED